MEILIFAGGIYTIILVIFHLMFWKIFNWKEDLRRLNHVNRAIMQVMNLSLTLVFIMFAYISLAHGYELMYSRLGHGVLWFMIIFWGARTIQQLVFFKFNWVSLLFVIYFALGTCLYLIPALNI